MFFAALELDFSMEVTGFDVGEIDMRIEQLPASGDDGQVRANRLPSPQSRTVTRPGDLWLLNASSRLRQRAGG